MSSSSKNSRFEVFEEKIKELQLSEEEQAAFRKAKSQLQNHTRLGALAGLFVGGYVSKVRKFTIGTSIAISIGSIAIGSQIGFFTGAAAGIRTVKSLPNSQRIFEIVREVQKVREVEHEDNNKPSTFPDEFSSDNQDFNDIHEGQQSSWTNLRSPSAPSRDDNNGSSWDKVRAQNSGSSTWDKIRQNNKVGQQHKPTSDIYNDGNENLPRTKEDFDELYNKGKIRTNLYGDAEIRYE
ncbi:17518_t:CDS:2 [Funneliformis caledonium]|uniref:17518_t:CDS:1 n=1 Tax=Funneliformis caledonium TaxID=1117310 RepID=A0A9N9H8H3_9GLOM|nr:17518_t:CDS:2 [Funneliformis caledonium]